MQSNGKKYAQSLKLVSSVNSLVKGAHGQKQMQSMHVQTLAYIHVGMHSSTFHGGHFKIYTIFHRVLCIQ
jgi:hypothetical protein